MTTQYRRASTYQRELHSNDGARDGLNTVWASRHRVLLARTLAFGTGWTGTRHCNVSQDITCSSIFYIFRQSEYDTMMLQKYNYKQNA